MPTRDERLITIEGALSRAEPRIRKAFMTLIAAVRADLSLSWIERALRAGRWEEALMTAVTAAPNFGTIGTKVLVDAAQDVAEQIGRTLGRIVIDFDATNPWSMGAIRENHLRLVREFTTKQRVATREALIDGVRRGMNPRDMARVFKDSIGLTQRQVRAVNNFRKLLSDANPEALTRALRDKRFDSILHKMVKDGSPPSRAQIETMTNRYRERYLKYRSEVIGRTEALRSVHQGQQIMFEQAANTGQLQEDGISREWNTAADERVRDSHSTLHGQVRGLREPFVTAAGVEIMYPGDPNAPAEETIQCRCSVGTRLAAIGDAIGTVGAVGDFF